MIASDIGDGLLDKLGNRSIDKSDLEKHVPLCSEDRIALAVRDSWSRFNLVSNSSAA